MEVVRVINYRAKAPGPGIVVNTTSRSNDWGRGLSPFVLGPVELYNGFEAQNFENGYQFCKVYANMTDADGNPSADYWDWARAGWASGDAKRYPMGRGAAPLYSLWDGERLGYISARKRIYCQLYSAAVEETDAWEQLVRSYDACKHDGTTLYLRDFDGYDRKGRSYAEVLNDPAKKMGHAFVLAMMLEKARAW